MSKSAAFEADFLELIFNATAIADLAEDHTTGVANLYLSLHTADPGEGGDQTSNETSYTNYARQAVARTSGGFTVSVTEGRAYLTSDVDFPTCGATPGSAITHFGVGTVVSGAGYLIYSGTVSPNITMAEGVIPRLKTTSYVEEQ